MHANQTTFIDIVLHWAESKPDEPAFTYHDFPSGEPHGVSFGELADNSRAVSCELQKYQLAHRNVLLLFNSGLEFITAFFACIFTGAVAIPMHPPNLRKDNNRLLHILTETKVEFVLTTSRMKRPLERYFDGLPTTFRVRIIAVDELDASRDAVWRRPAVETDDTVFIQYTSGSTNDPKGVMVSHGNLIDNERIITRAFAHDERTVVAGWLPLFHDMGLIGNILQPAYLGVHCVLIDPLAFIQRPIRWLRLISKYRATTSGGPSFGYDLCVRRIDESEAEGLDLSSWSLAFCGSEPVTPDVLMQFSRKFSKYGFEHESFYPCYGLAEATLFVTGVDKGSGPASIEVDSSELSNNVVCLARPTTTLTTTLVSCGYPRQGQLVKIVDPKAHTEHSEGVIGEIWLSGSSVAQGYWQQAAANARVFNNSLPGYRNCRFLRTGDLGFLLNGQLFITGRIKDLIIIRGRNHYPHDLEETVMKNQSAFQRGSAAAFSVIRNGEEKLVLVQEVSAPSVKTAMLSQLKRDICERITREHGLSVFDLLFVKSHTIPKTSSGKTRRTICREQYENGSFGDRQWAEV